MQDDGEEVEKELAYKTSVEEHGERPLRDLIPIPSGNAVLRGGGPPVNDIFTDGVHLGLR